MNRTRNNTRSTSKETIKADNNPPHDPKATCEVYCFSEQADQTTGTIYTDLTGKFPVQSLHVGGPAQ